MKTNTGLALSKVKGPLTTLNNNLSGENGEYWLNALKKLLRQEEIPDPLDDLTPIIDVLHKNTDRRVHDWMNLFRTIPAVLEVELAEDKWDGVLFIITISTSLKSFLSRSLFEDSMNYGIKPNGDLKDGGGSFGDTDVIHDKWCKDGSSQNISEFYEALIKLSKMYQDGLPKPPTKQ